MTTTTPFGNKGKGGEEGKISRHTSAPHTYLQLGHASSSRWWVDVCVIYPAACGPSESWRLLVFPRLLRDQFPIPIKQAMRVCMCYLLFINRYMQPKGPFKRLAAARMQRRLS